jgi:hypothetical protein
MIITALAAIDPGVNGGLSVLNDNGEIELTPLPKTDEDIFDLLQNVREAGIKKLHIEEKVLFTGQKLPGSRMIVYGDSCGFVRGIGIGLGFTVSIIRPQQWQSVLGLSSAGIDKSQWKAHLATTARAYFPNTKITLQTADAALIALAAKQGFPGTIRCGTCYKHLSTNKFFKNSQPGSRCKTCATLITPAMKKRWWLRYHYNMSQKDFDSLFQQQKGLCGICHDPLQKPNVDHDHTINVVRGLLCQKCNWGLGQFRDSPQILRTAADYLELQR